MKIQKINKEKFKNWTIFLFFLVVSVLNSCSNFLSFDENRTDENKTAAQDDKCIITVSSDFYSNDGSRAAFPDFLLSPDTLYFAEISYTSGSSKKWLGEDSVSDTAVVLKNNYSDVIRFVFCAPQETSAYTLALYACPKQTGSQVSAVKKSAFAQGDAAFELSAGQKVLSSTLNIKLKPQESSGNGKVDLPLSFDPALGIVAAKVNVTKDGVSDSGENNYGFKIKVSRNSATLSAENAPAGTYLAIMKFYNSTTDFLSSTEVAVNSAVQQISVYSEMTTNLWFIGAKKHGTTEADGTFTPSALELTKYDFTELYVCGTDGGGESDGKRSFYVSSNFGSSVPDGNDTYDGSMAKPFATVQKAVDTIAASGDTSKKYTIYVDGTVEPTYADTALSDETFISIKGTTPSNLDLTIKGLSAVSKAVLNAKQKDRRYGRVLTSKNTSLTLENLKITGGKVNNSGGIYIISGNLTLKKCAVTKNESSDGGGGIQFDGEKLIVEDSEISGNKGDPGGICVAASSAKTKIKDSDIIKNSARSGGGGLDLVGESIIEDCNITDNKAEFSTGGGGGLILAFNNKSCKIIKSVIKNNIAGENGGGIYINGGTLSLESGAAISENTAGENGGGIYIRDGLLNLESGAAISNNTAKKDGGAIYASCEYSIITVNIGEKDDSDDIVIEKNNAKRGGAFYGADNARFVMNAGKVSENYSTRTDEGGDGGAMFLWGGTSKFSTFTMNGGEIIGNMAKNGGAGGAVHIDDGSGKNAAFIMTGGLLSGNKTTDENGNSSNLGGAIYVKNGGQIKLGGSAVIAVENDGNDIWLADGKTITVTGTLTPGNNAAAGNPKYTARITPESYTLENVIIQGEGELDSSSCAKFLVTANAADELKYKIKYDSSSKTGKLATTQNIVINGKEYDKTALEDVIDVPTTITGSGEDGVFIGGRTVTLSPYSIGKYEVTQELFEAVMGKNPSEYQGETHPPANGETQELRPVEKIRWHHAIVFCNRLSMKIGLDPCYTAIRTDGNKVDYMKISFDDITNDWRNWQSVSCDLTKNGYRLPTAAEWEFAARGGDQSADAWNYTYAGSNNIGDVAWYKDNSDGISHEVGKKNPNSLGLYDMSGNCWEFCWDITFNGPSAETVIDPMGESTTNYRSRPSGSYSDSANDAKVVQRYSDAAGVYAYTNNGFRLARSGFPRAN